MRSKYIKPNFNVATTQKLESLDDWTAVDGLEAKPPDVYRYFVRVKSDVLNSFVKANGFTSLTKDEAEAEFVNQNSITA